MSAQSPQGPPYQLIATDLDGTLLRGDETVSGRSRAALAAAVEAGAAHIVVTGRAASSTVPILDDLGYRGLAVCGQGAQVYHAGEHRLLTSVTLDRRLAALTLAKIEAETGPLILAASQDGLDGAFLAEDEYRVQTSISPRRLHDRDQLREAPLAKLFIQHPRFDDDELARIAHGAVGDLVGIVIAGEGIVEVLPLGLSKATGLSLAARRLGIPGTQTIAFGDMPNDIPMFAWSAHGVAMANAHPGLKAVADEITTSNDDDGIALVIERAFAF